MNKIEEIEKYMLSTVLDEALTNTDKYENKYKTKDELRAALKADGYSDNDISSGIDLIGLSKGKPVAKSRKVKPTAQKAKPTTQQVTTAPVDTTTQPVDKTAPAATTQQVDTTQQVTNAPVDTTTQPAATTQQVDNAQSAANTQQVTNAQPAANTQQVTTAPVAPQSMEAIEQDFAVIWNNIKNDVSTISTRFMVLKKDAQAKGYIKNPEVLGRFEKATGFMASLGSAAALVGTIMSFIPGLQVAGAATRGLGMAVGGAGTLLNRGKASIRDFKNHNLKGGFSNLGMAAMGGLTAFAGGKTFGNTLSPLIGGRQDLSGTSAPRDTSGHTQGAAYQNPHQAQVGANAPINPTPQTYNDVINTINTVTGGNQANWPDNPNIKRLFTPTQISLMQNIINKSPAGIAQMNALNDYIEQNRLAADNTSMKNQYLDHANGAIAAQAAAQDISNNYDTNANNLQNQYDNTSWTGGGPGMEGRNEYAANMQYGINKNRNLAKDFQGIYQDLGNQVNHYNNQANIYGDRASANIINANNALATYNQGAPTIL